MTTRSKQGNGDIGRISATEDISEQSGNLLMIVQSTESTNQDLMYIIRRENQMTCQVMQTLIEEANRVEYVTKALL